MATNRFKVACCVVVNPKSVSLVCVILELPRSLKFSDRHLGFSTACNLQFSSRLKLTLLLLFPFFQISAPAAYALSGVYKALSCGKDEFYHLLCNGGINRRGLGYSITKQLIKKPGKATMNEPIR